MMKTYFSLLLGSLLLLATACTKKVSEAQEEAALSAKSTNALAEPSTAEEDASEVIVDCAVDQGKIMNMNQANGTSTSSPIPGETSRRWLQGLRNKVTRVWIQLVFVYNNGNINYNYKYDGSRVPVEDALEYYSTTSDSLMICLSGHRNSGTKLVPAGEAYIDFVRDLILHYKRKFPKIKYIQCSNEPDGSGETMTTYYPVYQKYYRGLNEANAILQQEAQEQGLSYDRIRLSNGSFTSNVPNMLDYADGFFDAYAADPDPSKKLDFFSYNSYGEANRPKELLTARHRIDSAILSHELPIIPVFFGEFGIMGGTGLPSGMTLAQTVTMQPAGQLTKAFYLYEGGIDKLFNWLIHHSSIAYKSELLDPENGIRSPYGHTLELSRMLADRKKRVSADSKSIDAVGLGLHAMAAEGNNKGVAVLLWNYNWRNTVADRDIKVLIKNIPDQHFLHRKMHISTYVIDSKNNNYFINPSQTDLQTKTEQVLDYEPYLSVQLRLERSSVIMILITPEKENNGNH